MYFFLKKAFLFLAECHSLPGFELYLNTVCYGDATSYLASCIDRVGIGSRIAIVDIMAGVNLKSNGCPDIYTETADSSCCTTKDADCKYR